MKKSIKALFTVCTMALCLTFLLAGCELFVKDCEHTYDNACDTTCNLCGEAREASAHQWKDATCTSLKTCTVCGYTEGEMGRLSSKCNTKKCFKRGKPAQTFFRSQVNR